MLSTWPRAPSEIPITAADTSPALVANCPLPEEIVRRCRDGFCSRYHFRYKPPEGRTQAVHRFTQPSKFIRQPAYRDRSEISVSEPFRGGSQPGQRMLNRTECRYSDCRANAD